MKAGADAVPARLRRRASRGGADARANLGGIPDSPPGWSRRAPRCPTFSGARAVLLGNCVGPVRASAPDFPVLIWPMATLSWYFGRRRLRGGKRRARPSAPCRQSDVFHRGASLSKSFNMRKPAATRVSRPFNTRARLPQSEGVSGGAIYFARLLRAAALLAAPWSCVSRRPDRLRRIHRRPGALEPHPPDLPRARQPGGAGVDLRHGLRLAARQRGDRTADRQRLALIFGVARRVECSGTRNP